MLEVVFTTEIQKNRDSWISVANCVRNLKLAIAFVRYVRVDVFDSLDDDSIIPQKAKMNWSPTVR